MSGLSEQYGHQLSAFSSLGNVQRAHARDVAPGIRSLDYKGHGLVAANPGGVATIRFADFRSARLEIRFDAFTGGVSPILRGMRRVDTRLHQGRRKQRTRVSVGAQAQCKRLTAVRRLMGEINVVTYIDVMLVLLYFHVTAPLLTQGIQWTLPKAGAEPWTPEMLKNAIPMVLSGTGRCSLYMNIGGGNPQDP